MELSRARRVSRRRLLQGTAGTTALGIDTDGFDHPKKIFDLTEALIRRGNGDSNIESVLGGNFRRLLGTVWVPAPAKTAEGKAA